MNFSFNKQYFTDNQIIEYVNDPAMHNTILSIVDPATGHHLLLPVWTIFYKGKFYFSTDDYSKKCRIIAQNSPKIGISIMDCESFPNGRPGTIPYFSVSGTARIRTKEEFDEYEEVIQALYNKFDKGFQNKEAKDQWIDNLLHQSESRVLIEIPPEKTLVYEKIEEAVERMKRQKEHV